MGLGCWVDGDVHLRELGLIGRRVVAGWWVSVGWWWCVSDCGVMVGFQAVLVSWSAPLCTPWWLAGLGLGLFCCQVGCGVM